MSIEVISFRAEKGGTLQRQEEQLNKTKKDLQDLMKKVNRVVSVSTLENEDRIEFIAIVDVDAPKKSGKKTTLTVKKGR